MVSNALKHGHMLPKPPAVCIAGPKPPYPPLVFTLECYPDKISWYESTTVTVYGLHPARPVGELYSIKWTLTGGFLSPEPESENGEVGIGYWFPPNIPGRYFIKAVATWPDGTSTFAECSVLVVNP